MGRRRAARLPLELTRLGGAGDEAASGTAAAAVLGLGPPVGGAARELVVVAGATPLFRCLVRHRGGPCFPVKLPVALDAESAVFVYADPGHATATALHSWGAAHRGLWHALGRRGRSVEVVAVGRTSRELERARRVVRRQLRGVVGLLQAGRHAERGGLRRRAVARHGDGARHGAFESAVHREQQYEFVHRQLHGRQPVERVDAGNGQRQLGEQTLGEAELAALDRLGNGNGRYDLGDLLSWIERCRRGEARCGPTSTGSGPPSAAGLLAAAAAGRPWISRRTRRRGSGRPGRKSIRAARRRGRFAGYALATLLAVTMTLSCTEGSVGPAANVQDPGFLTVEWTGPAAGRGIGVLLELEGPGIEAVRAPGFELYESRASGRHEIVVAGSLRTGPLVQFRVPDRGQLPLYRVRVLEVAGEDYELRDAGQYRAVITLH